MKNAYFYKLCFVSMLLLAGLTLSVQSCNKKEPADTEEAAEEQNEAKFDNDSTGVDNDAKEDDSEFLMAVAEVDMKEIELGKLAQKSANADVKALGTMMVTEHSKTSEEVKGLAASKNITLPAAPTEDVQKAVEDFNKKKAADFNKDYADKMVEGHEKTIEKFEDYVKNGTDADIKAWAQKTIPVLQMHLQHSKEVQSKLK
ncbi:DUF4142 domain-containing protein [Flavobacterium sp. MAH-1]|uniref:DUF4142 domain-containing protein n=1 Tax=Flavobacterium agri TaxID=2743471 RepID=A0A7Y8Y014_9FLAO|nr:DUF4142 domain-containing protein [Flavobacterium agri]NUY79438.1 DUF4142 domain-containing protein [Flavobacterium agri]NYA69463.1 DUF4142 domain-containing protein [Flavobacterium agri]